MVRPPDRLAPRTTARIDAHLRRTGAVMLCLDRPWPGSALRLEVTRRQWSGLGDGVSPAATDAATNSTELPNSIAALA
ncbi:hypothetical protein KV557_32720 [Kitasatospora aureofaciens]|uniref:hypothetical protein n=1 Tax=Kitasatospora aureofaciens TaxID=1894 RepID=UPI001C467B64|nr:hypothetical protein [Kitasatospora aureofaciens]MBV6701813.1 hypothetical protein [Kitasatospora aureofaciens]